MGRFVEQGPAAAIFAGPLHPYAAGHIAAQPIPDQGAMRIVRLSAPFAPFSGDLADVDVLEIIRTWRFARGDRLHAL